MSSYTRSICLLGMISPYVRSRQDFEIFIQSVLTFKKCVHGVELHIIGTLGYCIVPVPLKKLQFELYSSFLFIFSRTHYNLSSQYLLCSHFQPSRLSRARTDISSTYPPFRRRPSHVHLVSVTHLTGNLTSFSL